MWWSGKNQEEGLRSGRQWGWGSRGRGGSVSLENGRGRRVAGTIDSKKGFTSLPSPLGRSSSLSSSPFSLFPPLIYNRDLLTLNPFPFVLWLQPALFFLSLSCVFVVVDVVLFPCLYFLSEPRGTTHPIHTFAEHTHTHTRPRAVYSFIWLCWLCCCHPFLGLFVGFTSMFSVLLKIETRYWVIP